MKRNLRFILTLFKLRLQQQMTYRLSFFGATLVDGSLFLLWLLMFQVIYSQVDSIGGWSKGQSVIFLGTFSMLNAINMTIYFFGVNGITGKIHSGALDHYLTKPVNPLLRLTFEQINLGSAPLLLLSAGIILYGVHLTGITVSFGTGLLYSLFVLLMAVLYYDTEVLIRTFPFLFLSTGGIEQLEGAAFNLCMRVPGVLFQGVFKLIFYFLLPYGIMATVPAQILTQTASIPLLLTSAATVFLYTIFVHWFWRFGLKRYKSASS